MMTSVMLCRRKRYPTCRKPDNCSQTFIWNLERTESWIAGAAAVCGNCSLAVVTGSAHTKMNPVLPHCCSVVFQVLTVLGVCEWLRKSSIHCWYKYRQQVNTTGRRVKWATEADVYRLPFSLIVSCCPGRDIRRSFSAALLAETSWTCLRPFRKVLTPFARRETTRAVLWMSLAIRMMFFPLISSFELPYAI